MFGKCTKVLLLQWVLIALLLIGAPIADATTTTPAPFSAVYSGSDREAMRLGNFISTPAYLGRQPNILKSAGSGIDSLRFTPVLPHSGCYRVYAWWPIDETAGIIQLRIQDRHGEHRQVLDQKRDGGEWRELGDYLFAAGPARIEFSEHDGPLLVDSIRVEYRGATAPALQLITDKLPLIETGTRYSARIAVSGGLAPFRFSVQSGRLPAGLQLRSDSGEIHGQTKQTGEFPLWLTVIDARGQRGSGRIQLDVIDGDPVLMGAQQLRSREAGKSETELATESAKPVSNEPHSADVSELLAAMAATPEGEWLRANDNLYSDVWTPAALRPLKDGSNPDPSKIIGAWSGFAWDSNRADLLLYGGGHANYSGNDVYRWRGSTRRWERASLPSEVIKDPRNNYTAIDGTDHAPSSAHTYDNNLFLPLHDRFLTFGGAAYNNGAAYMRAVDALSSRRTGPYLWDPNKANPNRVGGSTGSHVQRVAPYPEILGGDMWQNRDWWLHIAATPKLPGSHVNGCTGYAEEDGRDVVYVGARLGGGTAMSLFRYVIMDLTNPALDIWQQIGGYREAPQGQTVCSYDPQQKLFLRTGSATRPFAFWNVNTPGANNYESLVVPEDSTGEFAALLAAGTIEMRYCGLDLDPDSRRYGLWCGANQLWWLTPPAVIGTNGWRIERIPTPIGAAPEPLSGTGVLGKWKYIPNIRAFLALQSSSQGNIWIYKPIGWQPPTGDGNTRPVVSLTAPTAGQEFAVGTVIAIAADASDDDGVVTRVEFYNGEALLHSDTEAPYAFDWLDAPVGSHVLMARAFDDDNAQTNSTSVSVTVLPDESGTVTLQDGLSGYTGNRDAYLSSYYKNNNYGASVLMYENANYTPMLHFAIFQREGGPVPDNAVIQSATLQLYKYSAYDPRYAVHRLLQDWDERQATWNQRRTGISWAVAGANGAGSDYRSEADAEVQTSWSPGWIAFDVTAALQTMQAGEANNGWRVLRTGGDKNNLKKFHSSESIIDPSKRPLLEVTYSTP